MRLEFATKMRMAGEAAAVCDFADGNLRLQQHSLCLLGPQPSQIGAHWDSEEATEFPREMNLVTSCCTRDLRHGERQLSWGLKIICLTPVAPNFWECVVAAGQNEAVPLV
jgi:hypothetical protein